MILDEFLINLKKTCLIYRKNNSPRIFTFNEEIMNKKKFVQLDSIVLTIIYVRLIYKDFRVQALAYIEK